MKPVLARWAEFDGNDRDAALAELARMYVEMEDERAESAHLSVPGVNNGEVRTAATDTLDCQIRGYEACLRRLFPDLRNFGFSIEWARGLVGANSDDKGS